MKLQLSVLLIIAFGFSTNALAVKIAPSILFARSADLCRYKDTFGTEVTLESTLKAYIDGYYRDLRPREQKIIFIQPAAPDRPDYTAHGTFTLTPDCRGDLLVTLQLTGRKGDVKSYIGQGNSAVVMSQIAAKIFEDFQRTEFPAKIKVGAKFLTLLGGMNGSVDVAASPLIAIQSCLTLNARLPDEFELEIINAYGDWSGGVSLNDQYWALPSGKVFAPLLRNPSPVREVWEINADKYSYYCVQN